MIIEKTGELLIYYKHDGLTLELDQANISSNGLIDLLKRITREKFPNVKSFSISLVKEDIFEVQVSVMEDMVWKIN